VEKIQSCYCFRETPFGPVAVVWSVYRGQPRILRVLLSKPVASAEQLAKASFPDSPYSSCAEVDVVADQIAAFLSGDDIRFSLEIARLDLCSTFQQRVLRAEHGIPRGWVSTYRRIAGYLGNANAARTVGTALATNPFPIIIPCHRAIRSDGTLGGYQGGLEMKRALLEMEGIQFNATGRVVGGEILFWQVRDP
jgi:methylated-DNA-[protein]-cysteine S-methyltransferase